MSKILVGLDHVVCMMDDVQVVAKTKKEHVERLDAALTLHKEKCALEVMKENLWGTIRVQQGYKLTQIKRDAYTDESEEPEEIFGHGELLPFKVQLFDSGGPMCPGCGQLCNRGV